jgi:predicted DNA-binding mobile mystery protein A
MRNPAKARARQRLDERLLLLKPEERFDPPTSGWLRAIREALGMTGVQLAKRLRISPQSAEALEKSEATGTVQLNTLRRAAEALDCRLVYALVPKTSLEGAVSERVAQMDRATALQARDESAERRAIALGQKYQGRRGGAPRARAMRLTALAV